MARLILTCAGFVLAACVTTVSFAAAPYPDKPIRLLVPSPPGGGNDIMARIAAQRLADSLSKPVVVDNRAGAGGAIAFEMVANADPDGYTLLLGSTNLTVLPDITKVNYQPLRDFDPVSLLAKSMNILLVNPSVPVRSTKDLIDLAKKNPGKLNYASSTASSVHLAAELFKAMAGINIVYVPYKGMGPALIDLVAGNVEVAFSNPAASYSFIEGGKLRAIAVTGERRLPKLPNVPTIAESALPGFEASTWWGILAPKKTPAAVIGKLNIELSAALTQPEVLNRIAALGAEPIGGPPKVLADHLVVEVAKWRKVVQVANIRL